MRTDMKPESGWFRPPKLVECCCRGDTRSFLLVAEPELNAGIWGVGYEVAASLLVEGENDLLAKIHAAAKNELYRRIGDPKHSRGVGSLLYDFLWVPALKRLEDGTTTVVAGQP